MEKFKNKYRIPSARLATWDYSQQGMYFITICTKNRIHFFGEIRNDEMHLNEIGIIANKSWSEIPDHFKNVSLGEFVVMPNHIHGIIIINIFVSPANNINDPDMVETGHALSLRPSQLLQSSQSSEQSEPHFRFRNQGKNTISAMVGSFKSAVSNSARKIKSGFEWQTRFHDHIIRDNEDYLRISNYIRNNPTNWKDDKFYK